MNIGIDLDGVIFDMDTLFKYAFLYHKKEYVPALKWNMENYPEEVRETIFDMFSNKSFIVDYMPLKHDLYKLVLHLDFLKEQGHNLFIISNRFKPVQKATKEKIINIFEHDYFSDIIVCEESKIQHIKENNINLMIDDSPHVIQECLNNNIGCVMISDNKQFYNYHLRDKVRWYKSILDIEFF